MQVNVIRTMTSAGIVALFLGGLVPDGARSADATPAEARVIAKEAYVYGFPMVDSYRIQNDYFVNTKGSQYKGPWNHLVNIPRVYTPADTAIQTPNSDTPYSFLGMDLRAEPMVLTVPVIEKSRYFSIQLIDAYTFNFAYIGSRTTGNDGGSFLIAGPNWKVRIRPLSHSALQPERYRQCDKGASRIQGTDAVGFPWDPGTESGACH